MSVDLGFCGAAGTVTGSCYWITHPRGQFLVDCGLFQGSKTVRKLNYGEFPFKADEIDFVLLTHAPFARWTLICAVSGRTSDLLSG